MRWVASRTEPAHHGYAEQPWPDNKASRQSDPLWRQQLPMNGRSPSGDGALCRPLLGARSHGCQRGREQPPVWTGCRPRPRPGGLLTPRCPGRNARGFSLRSARRMHAGCHAGTRRRSHAKRVALSNVLLNGSFSPEIGHHYDRDRAVLDIVKALAALDPAGCGLDAASAQLEGRT